MVLFLEQYQVVETPISGNFLQLLIYLSKLDFGLDVQEFAYMKQKFMWKIKNVHCDMAAISPEIQKGHVFGSGISVTAEYIYEASLSVYRCALSHSF